MIFLIIITVYAVMIGYFYLGIDKLPLASENLKIEKLQHPLTLFSIIIPFRNEAERLPELLQAIASLAYPNDCFEVLFIDDESTDDSVKMIQLFKEQYPSITICILKNNRISAAPKKDAITVAINKAKFEWIITTDADCIVPQQWLFSFHEFIKSNKVEFIAGPLLYKSSNTFIHQYQLLDNLSLQGVTMGSFGQGKGLLCNGANLAYTKSLFNLLSGFDNNKHIASGDDIFMLENALNTFPEKVGYLKSGRDVVFTFPEDTWKDLISQRVRWAKKTGKQKSVLTKLVGIITFLTNCCVLLFPLLFFASLTEFWMVVSALFLKISVDFLLLDKTGRFFGKNISVVQVISHVYVYAFVSCWVVIKSMFTNYTWKQRRHRH